MENRTKIFSHRGGQTDYDKARNDPSTHNRPAENTLAAVKNALDEGADGIEIDIVRTKDGRLAVVHSANLSEHVFKENSGLGFVGDYTISELQENFRVGPRQDGVIPDLKEIIDFTSEYQKESDKEVILNIEIKDVKGTGLPKSPDTDVKDILAEYMETSPLNPQEIIISSFSLQDMIYMEKLDTGARLGFLFIPNSEIERNIYANNLDNKYVNFTVENIRFAKQKVPSLSFVHPCIDDVIEDTVKTARQESLGINSWSMAENHPQDDIEYIRSLVELCTKYQVSHSIITNFVNEMKFHTSYSCCLS